MSKPFITVDRASKVYAPHGRQEVPAVDELSLDIHEGELVALMGPSGSGKSTLLNLIGGLDFPTSGSVEVDGQMISGMKDKELDSFRLDTVGFVFQHFHLMPNFSVAENIALTALIKDRSRPQWIDRVTDLLSEVDLLDRMDAPPNTLSGGQQQRVAVCRALFGAPKVVLADEPTGNLDSKNSDGVLALLRKAVGPGSATAGVLVTHDVDAAAIADRILLIRDGRIRSEYTPDPGGASASDRAGEGEDARRIRAWIQTSSG